MTRAVSIALIAGHHLVDGISARALEAPLSYLWALLHQQMRILTVVVMFPACRWFAGVKARRRDGWLRYL